MESNKSSDWYEAVEDIIGMPMRPLQRDVLQELLNNNHVFAVLPTGYGKSVCFGAFPAAYKQIHPEEEAIALIIAPLNSLTTSHVENWREKGVSATVLKPRGDKDMNETRIREIANGEYTLLFASPEIVHQKPWSKVLRGLRDQIRLLAIDEAHCLSEWGKTFRKDFLKVGDLRAILPNAVTLALTATATTSLVSDVMDKLGLTDRMKIISLCPDRPEIFLKMEKVGSEMKDSLLWYINLIEQQKELAPKAIIFGRTIDHVIDIYFILNETLGNSAVKDGNKDNVNMRYTEMFHARTDKESQERTVTNFRQPQSVLRCVVATVAFGMGVDIPNVRYVLHWGPARDPLLYWQEVGRCARDGLPGEAITYIPPRSKDKRVIQPEMLKVIADTLDQRTCQRKSVLSNLKVNSGPDQSEPLALCCFNCL